ncbi:MAG TPA: MerR family transcriptional regulator [Rectinemataceae bacterium]|nr:MerR family transcriptional regulator [Rectinemataceae bacterium]
MGSAESPRTYRIGELAAVFGVTSRTIRYYEELGLLEAFEREDGGHRRYDERNAVHLKRIQQLKDYGLSLAEISELFDLARRDRSGESVRKRLAEKYREKLEEAEKRRRALSAYIEDLSWHIEQLERVPDFFDCPGASCASCSFSERCDVRLLLKRA